MKKERIFLIGNVLGSYRSQNLIKTLLDMEHTVFYLPFVSAPVSIYFIFRKPLNLILLLLYVLASIYFIAQSKIVFVLAMNFQTRNFIQMFIAKLLRKKIIVDYYISCYDTLVNDRKTVDKESFSSKVLLIKDKLLMNLSDKVIFLNNAEKKYYQDVIDINLPETKNIICPLVVDSKTDFYLKNKKVWKRNKISDDFTICWWGSYIPLHGLDKIIETFTFLTHMPVKLFIFGNNEQASSVYKDKIANLGLSEKVTIKNDFTFNNGKLQYFLENNCDLALGNFGDSRKAKTVLVNKVVDCLAMGLPCLTMKTKASSDLLPDNTIFYAEPTPEGIAEKIVYIINNPDESKQVGSNGYHVYKEIFSPEVFTRNIRSLLEGSDNEIIINT